MAQNQGGKWESRIDTSLGGLWSFVLTDSGGTYASTTLTEAQYYLSSPGNSSFGLLAEMAAALNTVSTSSDYTVTLSSSTGKVTIAKGSGTFSLTWGSTVGLRQALGFADNLASVTSETAGNQSPALWIPHTPWDCEVDLFVTSGFTVSDNSIARAPDGTMVVLGYNSRTEVEITYMGIEDRYVWTGQESTTNESLQTFWNGAVINDSNTWASRGSPIRFYPDLTSDATYWTYRSLNVNSFRPTRTAPPFVGLYDLRLALQIHVE